MINKPSVMFPTINKHINLPQNSCHMVRSPNAHNYYSDHHKHLHMLKSTSIEDPNQNRLESKPKHFSHWKPSTCWVFGTQTRSLIIWLSAVMKPDCVLTRSRDACLSFAVWGNACVLTRSRDACLSFVVGGNACAHKEQRCLS